VRLDELLVECVQLISTVARKKNIQIKIDVQDAVEIRADQDKMKRVFFNLLDNAVKYSGENTIVTASISQDKSRPEKIQIRFEDQGPGIPPSALAHIFTRFYRADPARTENAGIGLGLAIVQQLVELHGGTVTVKSEVGKGTTFHIELPGNISSQ
jgi:two-component system phosphate regulon sensor histidine kinase PhoR